MTFAARHVFYSVVAATQPAVVCDIGSRDGEHALRFRRLAPRARVVAFEANSANCRRIEADPRIVKGRVEVVNAAVTDTEGQVTFYELEQSPEHEWARGASSLHLRRDDMTADLQQVPVKVAALRLDAFLSASTGSLALWIDVEGAAGSVVAGLAGIAGRIAVVHIEVEKAQLWQGQATRAEVLVGLEALGLEVVGTSPEWGEEQENVVLVPRVVGPRTRAAVAAGRLYGRLRP